MSSSKMTYFKYKRTFKRKEKFIDFILLVKFMVEKMLAALLKKFVKPKVKENVVQPIRSRKAFIIRFIKPQYFKLPAPILDHILLNASAAVREKLIQCCKELLLLYKKLDHPYIDCLFLNPCYNNAIVCKKSGIFAYLNEKSRLFHYEKKITVKVTKSLIISGWDFWPKFAKMDISMLVELDIYDCKIDLWDAPKLNLPSIKKLKVANTRFVLKNELQFALQDFSNVEHVEFQMREKNHFPPITAIKRNHKLKFLKLGNIPDSITPLCIAFFMKNAMAEGSQLQLQFCDIKILKRINECTKNYFKVPPVIGLFDKW